MAAQTYEVRVAGPVPSHLPRGLDATVVEEPAQTVLQTSAIDQGGLHGLIDRLAALGLELLEVRRVGWREARGGATSASPREDPRQGAAPTYEVSIRGLLGPALLNALSDVTTSAIQCSSVWRFRPVSADDLAGVLGLLGTDDVLLVSLHRVVESRPLTQPG